MLNFHRVEALLFPSVPPKLRLEVESSVASRSGEAAGATGPSPESEAGSSLTVLASFSGPPVCELIASQPVHPGLRPYVEDHYLSALVGQWRKEQS